MPKGILFWVLMILWLIFGLWMTWPNYGLIGGNLLLWVVIALLGWQVFGRPIQ